MRKGLTPDRILEAAFAIVDADGAQALTMRRLAGDLDVAAMAIYNHFVDRAAVLDALAELAFSMSPAASTERRTPSKRSKHPQWRETLRRIVLDVHWLATKHPHIYMLAVSRPQKPDGILRLMAASMQALRDAGLTDRQAVTAYHSILMVLQGFPHWHASMQRHCGTTSITASKLQSPAMVRDWKLIYGVDATVQFSQSLDWLLDSIASTPPAGRDASQER